MSTALSAYAVPNAVELINVMGEAIAKSQMLGCQNADQGRVLAMACLAKQQDPLSLAQRYDIIQGKLAMKSAAMLAEFRARGGRQKMIERTPEAAEVELSIDDSIERFRLTWEEAQQEDFTKDKKGNIKSNYSFPRKRMQMLWARVVSDGVNVMCPEVNCGLYTPEEVGDIIDAENFESVAPPPATSSSAPASASSVEGSAVDVPTDAEFEQKTKASGQQIKRMTQLFAELDVSAEAQMRAFRGVGASSMVDVSSEGADQIIAKMESHLAASSGSTPAATPEQIAEVKSLLDQVSQREGKGHVPLEIQKHLNAHGISKLTQLNQHSMDLLVRGLREDCETSLDSFLGEAPQSAGESQSS
ncbi:hypothetical protein [Crateriforma conspicua]|uniref:RecT family protein n=1 Tax=Crateriforma conspicua TaxID=2527996 RepID=A0A5C5XR11_9PLAN|nr:hypothetical protein [Crateriforma conspicua]TWT65647.1 hypothetical protein Pan14r_51940 [Crateriforma conspicua]